MAAGLEAYAQAKRQKRLVEESERRKYLESSGGPERTHDPRGLVDAVPEAATGRSAEVASPSRGKQIKLKRPPKAPRK